VVVVVALVVVVLERLLLVVVVVVVVLPWVPVDRRLLLEQGPVRLVVVVVGSCGDVGVASVDRPS